jgi:UDP-N-acetylglucosamine:LPS N-acetylglucosamine transferase
MTSSNVQQTSGPDDAPGERSGHSILLLDAGMGDGHRAVARELAQRLRGRGHRVHSVDVLELLPPGAGAALRAFYRTMVRRTPWVYDAIYSAFLDAQRGPGSTPLAAIAGPKLRHVVQDFEPRLVVPVFHLAAQITGRMRQRGELTARTAVMITDFAVHQQWLHPGNDLHLCVSAEAAQQVQESLGRPAHATGPVVPERFHRAAAGPGRSPSLSATWSSRLGPASADKRLVLVSTGSWGVADGLAETATRLAAAGYFPVLLCGRDERARARLSLIPGVHACGWIDDLDDLMAAAGALIDNAAGQTAVQALAAGVPVVGYRPIAGHGRQGVERMARIGVSQYARTADDLIAALGWLTDPASAARAARIKAGYGLFTGDPADSLEKEAARPPP